MFSGVRSTDYTSGARAVVNNMNAATGAAMAATSDFGGIAETGMKAENLKAKTKYKTDSNERIDKADVDTMVEIEKIKRESAEEVKEIMKPAQRMAGLLAAANTGTAALMIKQESDLYKKEQAELKAQRDEESALRKEETAEIKEIQALQRELLQQQIESYRNQANQSINASTPGGAPATSTPLNTGDGQLVSAVQSQGISTQSPKISQQEVYSYLRKDKGLDRNKALGLMANIQRESTFNPKAVGDGGKSFGLFQWYAGRGKRMRAAVPNWDTNWKGQIDYALTEQGMNSVNNTFLNTNWKSPEEAGAYWTEKWEIPADIAGGIKKQNAFIKSYNFVEP